MPPRTLILSDLHLGRGADEGAARSAVAALAPLWADVDQLVLNGDSAEIHHPRMWGRAARAVLELIDRCDTDGVDLTILSGNHDPWLSDVRHLSLAGGSILVTHGDVMHPAVAPWSPAAGRMRRAFDQAVARLPQEIGDRLEGRLVAAQHASFAEWEDEAALRSEASRSTVVNMLLRPWSFLQVLHYWSVFPRLAAAFAAEHAPDARVVVTGHTHRPGAWRVGGRLVLNTGSFVAPTRPRAVLVEERTVSLHRIVRGAAGWRREEAAQIRETLALPPGIEDVGLDGTGHPGPAGAPASRPTPTAAAPPREATSTTSPGHAATGN